MQRGGSAKQVARGRDRYAAGDDAFDEVAPGDGFRNVFLRQVWHRLGTCLLGHTGSPNERVQPLLESAARKACEVSHFSSWISRNNAGIRKFSDHRRATEMGLAFDQERSVACYPAPPLLDRSAYSTMSID